MSLSNIYLTKLETIERKFEDLAAKLSDPEIISDPSVYAKLAKEHSELTEIVSVFKEYKKVLKEIEENKTIIEEETDEELVDLAKEELKILEKRLEELEKLLPILLLPKDPNDEKNVILEIRAGAGGEEAALFAAELLRMYQRYAERKGWKFEILDANDTGLGGFKEVVAKIEGKGAYSRLKYESGVHRVQRVPITESSGRIHTSTVTVAVLPEVDEVDIEINPEDLKIETMRASGHGGQHVNKTESAVRITHIPTGIVVTCQNERSQHQNKATALKILRAKLYELAQREQHEKIQKERRAQVGTGERCEKIRTYNFPQNRVTDHRVGITIYNLPEVLDGDLDEFIDALIAHYRAEMLKQEEGLGMAA
ncbi:MAG: Peptide chain release factor 1 [Thermodesulfobacterium sp. 37_54]|jgi:peptide chain release factor 1|uniref:Peptide chain release factor 1 n=1 Tax=Thermodesulfobacterium commune DSM 2178 TaxID=289377 RepID=A0A075WUR4_9BACT|nr:peptide chain release factor 1 [Thermodesulfobacterium commune]KUJ97100.1 MAG: Peptide chain release factor 1 [Thermodesulfobacterium sp. 37_54]AIH04616.1 peptide chain release factor 1 [Thermodesulfobacterium commune DSM 2178]KUK18892.1 MAG: Peptide chain release factor 1 [Thermodesulfobacterium commune]HBT03320.1 peptide chain release factor 1 [Thermodesulfobacterium commune]HCP10588.1 peptide chain release factor 1 [Thermodesulfobacterium commune]